MSHHTLQNIRDFVRGHLDIEEDDLSNAVLDHFIREGSKRVERAEKRWPFYEKEWSFNTVAGTSDYTLTSIANDISEVGALISPRQPLDWIGRDEADRWFPLQSATTGYPVAFSQWAEELRLYPTPDAVYTIIVRGYRKPTEWVDAGAGATPDMHEDLRNCVAQWALARAYAQQDDPEMASLFERQFADELNFYRRRINNTPPPQPFVLNGQRSVRGNLFSGRLPYSWE